MHNLDPNHLDGFQRVRHARYFENDAVYHIIFRTTQGLFLLKPDAHGRLRRVIAGILGRTRQTFPGVRCHAATILSNHGHLAISGDVEHLAAYVGFIKRELSRRWGPRVGWRGLFEEGYHATAVITPEAQRRCLKYVLGQGVKEGLVTSPQDWPGLHCAHALVTGEPIVGEWFNGTSYGTAFHRNKRKRQPAEVHREDYIERCDATFDPLPAMRHLSDAEHRHEMAALVDEVVAEGREQRAGRAPLGADAVVAMDPMTRRDLAAPPWFEDRRHMVVWDDLRHTEVRGYVQRYWCFQEAFRDASDRWLKGDLTPQFPAGAFRPGLPRPTPHMRSLAA